MRRPQSRVKQSRQVLLRAADDDPLRHHIARIVPAQGHQPQQALVVDMRNHEADLVHVRGDHQLFCFAAATGLFDRDQIAQRIYPQLVGQRRQLAAHDLAQASLAAGNARALAQFFEQFHPSLLCIDRQQQYPWARDRQFGRLRKCVFCLVWKKRIPFAHLPPRKIARYPRERYTTYVGSSI